MSSKDFFRQLAHEPFKYWSVKYPNQCTGYFYFGYGFIYTN